MNLETIKARFGIVGHSNGINNAIEVAVQVAPTEVTVLIQGENGTGKDVFSKIIHQYSKRKHQPFMAINCGAIPEGTIDSELFGHEKGSFTSAYDTRKGYFEEVNGGTIFLDEIGEMPLATQSRLLRLLESGEYLRVGSSKVRKTEIRLVAASNKNLIDLIRQGKFREDLYFRLNTVSIKVPPLRERGQDIELLFRFFLSEFAEKYNRPPLLVDDTALDILYDYRWPGNVRELKNFAEKMTVLVQEDRISAGLVTHHLNVVENYLPEVVHLPNRDRIKEEPAREIEILYKLIFDLKKEVGDMKSMLYVGLGSNRPGGYSDEPEIMESDTPEIHKPFVKRSPYGGNPAYNVGTQTVSRPKENLPLLEESLSLEKKEREMIEKALSKFSNNRKKAAKELGISERTLYRKIKQYGLDQ